MTTAAKEIYELKQVPETPMRCRQLTKANFSLEKGVDEYISVYQKL